MYFFFGPSFFNPPSTQIPLSEILRPPTGRKMISVSENIPMRAVDAAVEHQEEVPQTCRNSFSDDMLRDLVTHTCPQNRTDCHGNGLLQNKAVEHHHHPLLSQIRYSCRALESTKKHSKGAVAVVPVKNGYCDRSFRGSFEPRTSQVQGRCLPKLGDGGGLLS